jgi:pimeloyl-ACP methyl ester carboxylesterase
MARSPRRRLWPVIRRIWITTGLLATFVFVTWSLLAFRATSEAVAALDSDARVRVSATDFGWSFMPAGTHSDTGLLFFAGAMVDPRAYAPLLRRVAEAGHPVMLVALPRRGVMGGADGAEVLNRGVTATLSAPDVRQWVLAGHSKGGKVAAELARVGAPSFAGLVLIGTSHPRDFSLANTRLPVTRIYGTRDTVADVEKLEQNRINLPPAITDVPIDGGNHSQFGYYGFQPGDWPATISRQDQQRQTLAALLAALGGSVGP